MKETIKLQRFDDNFEDFWDSEKEAFIVYAGKLGASFDVKTDAVIVDYNGVTWNCWLDSAKYIPKMDMYELTYKPY